MGPGPSTTPSLEKHVKDQGKPRGFPRGTPASPRLFGGLAATSTSPLASTAVSSLLDARENQAC